MDTSERHILMGEEAVWEAITRMAREIVERNGGTDLLSVVGIQRRGVHLAGWLADAIERHTGVRPPVGTLDITLYRDDLTAIGPRPVLGETRLPAEGVDGRRLVIADDVLYTGRTARAALDELADFGRPRRIWLCVLVDRGGRELPIAPDFVGQVVEASPGERVEVRVPDLDGRLGVELIQRTEEAP